MSTIAQPAPYAADTRARGWRFEIDHERIRQSDTWALAKPEVRPWLLMLWMVAWEQVPCGSLPNDDALIAARIDMPAKTFAKHRAVLLRGWWLADDGRLYHNVIAGRVLAMLEAKRKESDRKAAYRLRMDAQRRGVGAASPVTPANVPRDTTWTDAGLTWDAAGCDDTGTGTGTLREELPHAKSVREVVGDASPTPAGLICRAMKSAGIADVNPGHPDLAALVAAGVTEVEAVGAAEAAVKRSKGFAYALGTLVRQRTEAAEKAKGLHNGPLPGTPEATPWHETAGGIKAKGAELGIAYTSDDECKPFAVYRNRVYMAAGYREKAVA